MTQLCVGYFKIFISIICIIALFFKRLACRNYTCIGRIRAVMWKIYAREGKIMDQVCAKGKGIYAKREKRWNRYVPEAKKYMRNKEKDEIGMCQRQENTCEKEKNTD